MKHQFKHSSMKLIPRFLILAIIAASAQQSINAEEPGLREQFKTAVAAYQKDISTLSALKVIEIYKQLEPPPAVPEEAREPFVMGATVLKESNDASSAAKAVELFGKAIQLVPWWSEARYNHALALEASGQFHEAIGDLSIYLAFKLTEAERREAQDKIYALKAKAEIATAKKTEEDKVAAAKKADEEKAAAAKAADTPQAREAALLQKVEGTRFVVRHSRETTGVPWTSDEILEIKNRTLHITIKIYSIEPPASQYGHNRPGEYLVDRISYRDGAFTQTFKGFTTVYRIRPDAQGLLRQCEGISDLVIPRS
jgi:hypothetical protein